MTPTDQLKKFREEISGELEQLDGELTSARCDLENAERLHRAEIDRWQAVRDLTARALPANPRATDGIAGPLYDRIEGGREDAIKPLSRALSLARSRVKSIESSIENRRLALRQIDAATAPTEKAANVTELTRRRKAAAPVDFDTISMPQEATNVTR
ncbi:MAG TPA: hypothetical protein VJ738_01900 [Steroidobacteraceae bacterium]|nr:hypothetical protein [Steroidobacteraceae bacterium]